MAAKRRTKDKATTSLISKIAKTKAPSAKAARKLTANNNGETKVYNLSDGVSPTTKVSTKNKAVAQRLDPGPDPIRLARHPAGRHPQDGAAQPGQRQARDRRGPAA